MVVRTLMMSAVLLLAAGCTKGVDEETKPVMTVMESSWADQRNIEPIDAAGLDAPTNATTDAPTDEVTQDTDATAATYDVDEPAIDPSTTPRTDMSSTSTCSDGKRVCGDMTSCDDAVFHLRQCGMSRLDGDSDGTPCEKICG